MPQCEPFRVVVIDDSPLQGSMIRMTLQRRFGDDVAVTVFQNPREGVEHLDASVQLLLLDWQMPEMDGYEVFQEAVARGVDPKRIIISSSHPAHELHDNFDKTGCLAVIEKGEARQENAFQMILDSLVSKHTRRRGET